MISALQKLLDRYRKNSRTEREKGEYFELLVKNFLENDPLYTDLFSQVWTYAEWARSQDLNETDTGIDLVAKLAREEGHCAIQCKFYQENYKIQKKDIDSFFTASGKKSFKMRLIVDSTAVEWSNHAEDALKGQTIPITRLSLRDLELSPLDWETYARDNKIKLLEGKHLYKHQREALKAVGKKFGETDRGKLLMACGTGKTLTSLRIAEQIVGKGGCVLYLVPSLSLMSQTIRKWTHDAELELRSFAVCSDVHVGKRKARDDLSDINIHDLAYPATTNAEKLGEEFSRACSEDRMNVVFSTYHSIQVISKAQADYGLPEFDLIVCDEAHRTTGATLANKDESNFIKVHYQDFIKGKKRLYMTATPRIFHDSVKTKAKEADAVLCSMDDPELYGETFHEVSFSYAVENNLLTDYKVIVLAMDEGVVSESVQKRLTDTDSQLVLDDVTKIIGCYRALAKLDLKEDLLADAEPMSQAVAFCKSIKSSELIKKEFAEVVSEYLEEQSQETGEMLRCEVEHVDGTFNAKERGRLLDWLSAEKSEGEADQNTCRILSNARCLSEGVDVPALDAILFMHPRKSQIDVVQSVGRVMRRAPGKNMGYVILPIGIPAGIPPSQALRNNEKYKTVWQILNALRAHDDRFDSMINKIDLGVDVSDRMEIVAVVGNLPQISVQTPTRNDIGSGSASGGEQWENQVVSVTPPEQLSFELDDFNKAVLAKIVQKCGTREYWEDWAGDVAKIAQTHITRIGAILKEPDTEERRTFDKFLEEVRDDLNESISESGAIEMLSQHLITKPVFDALFEGYSFSQQNPVSIAMQGVLDALQAYNLDNETESLDKFYASVRMRASGIDNDGAKQQIIIQLYEKFFKNAFPGMTEKLGIVYTPVEIVDFIIHSVNDVLQSEFGQTLSSKGVHILDPFVGTGTFITRLLQSGLIKPQELEHKYKNELHANEIVLLAYYIAAINIEAAYHALAGGKYEPFEGVCLTDTFQLYEKDDMISEILVNNSDRRIKQKKLDDIRVIMANPPYRGTQRDAGDNLANVSYPNLDKHIGSTYVAHTDATNKNSLYNSFVRAFRWGSDRLGDRGILAYVSSASFIRGRAMDGFRKCLADEFSSIHVFNLRGDARTSGEQRRKESGNVFGEGSREPIAITVAVKNPAKKKLGRIYYHDIGNYLSRKEKLAHIKEFKSISGIKKANNWNLITPDKYNDWIGQRDKSFDEFIPIGNKKDKSLITVFQNYSRGLATCRDVWCYNSSKEILKKNMQSMISFYNSEVDRLLCARVISKEVDIDSFINTDKTKISWTHGLKQDLNKEKKHSSRSESTYLAMYRPFFKQYVYYNRDVNERVYQMPNIFPKPEVRNRVIVTTGVGTKVGFSVLMTNHLPDVQMLGNCQCFPLKLYEKAEDRNGELYKNQYGEDGYIVKDGISDAGLDHFQKAYSEEKISKEDVFYYIYGRLHSEDYRKRYANNLSKQLPRIPCVKKSEDFWAFSNAGRELADLHVNYEVVKPYPVNFKEGDPFSMNLKPEDFRVEKMKFGGNSKNKDRTTVIYNHKITMTDIPLEAYEYMVNGKPALEWVMERQGVRTDKDSGIVNDANLYAKETVNSAAYPLDLFRRIITVSLETIKIVKSLPKLDQFRVTNK